jgi:hypothetical protein
MAHPLVTQLRFTRSEFVRGLGDVPEEDGCRRLAPMNCISWIVGHLASQELYLWVEEGLDEHPFPGLHELVGWGSPASTPSLAKMWSTWRSVTAAADRFLEGITEAGLQTDLHKDLGPHPETAGTKLLRNIYHYWFHLGEGLAIRQMLGHTDLPQFVGNMSQAPYHPGK